MNQLTLQLSRAHENRQLFSNHFLEERLRRDALWIEIAADAERVRGELKRLLSEQLGALGGAAISDGAIHLESAGSTGKLANEAQTEERWIRPVLRALGWGWQVQPVSRRQGSLQFPDYALFPSKAEADSAASAGSHRKVLNRASGVLEAKRWLRPLDAGGAVDDLNPNRVPSTQIINYLIRAGQPWGILTNGAEWRLYYRDADFADAVFFGVDLLALLGDDPLPMGEGGETIPAGEAFRYFYLFFRQETFAVGVEDMRWLDRAYQSSTRYARAVEDALKPRAYRAVTVLCRGFASADGIDPATIVEEPELANEILDNSLTLLFRLLFLLYAESRDLLPVRGNDAYRTKSLLHLRERAARARDRGEDLFPRGKDFWSDLHDLFEIVDGDEKWREVGIPVYNGGLFDPERHPWLEDHYAADPALVEALDLLSRVEEPESGEPHFVDYGPLNVRHLGSIYEGLLEHTIRSADEDLPEIREKGRVIRDPVRAGELYLATENGERHATGSYYTPDYVVQYIVEQTLNPLLENRTPAEILELRVLDPAMGSGHFLVAATAHLARAAVRAVEEAPQQILGPFAALDPEHLRRLVVERCIFGVDKNPRAVELAKLSLWLATVQRDKPLNFLDHHLKCGDSLLGARVERLGGLSGRTGRTAALESEGQFNAFEGALKARLHQVIALVNEIESMPSDSLEDIERKEMLYREADGLLERFRAVADVWTSRHFGSELKSSKSAAEDSSGSNANRGRLTGREGEGDNYARAVAALRSAPDWDAVAGEPWVRRAEQLSREFGFFHWEVEFGEAFYDEKGEERAEAGFDAVIGNPPYVRMEKFKELKKFLRSEYETYATRSDLYVYFMERSLDLLRPGGEYGIIVSNKFLRANYGKKLRALIGRDASVREMVDFGELPVFEDAAAMPMLFFAHLGEVESAPRFAQMTTLAFEDLAVAIEENAFALDPSGLVEANWRILPREVAHLLDKMDAGGTPLGELVDGKLCWGIKTGRNKAFFIDKDARDWLIADDARSAEVIKPLVVGNDVRRYRLERSPQWLLYLPHGVDISRYPAVERYLEPFREDLEARATQQAWYELQQPQAAYREFFEGSKIIYPDIAKEPRFALHNRPLYPTNTCFFIPEASSALLAILNSKLIFFYLGHTATILGDISRGGRVRLFRQYMERVPIPQVERTTSPEKYHEEGERLRSIYHESLRTAGIDANRIESSDDPDHKSAESGEAGFTGRGREGGVGVSGSGVANADGVFRELEQEIDGLLPTKADGKSTTDRRRTDVVSNLLGFLAERMTELHQRRQDEVADFLDWLEKRLGCPIDELSGKTKLRRYYQPDVGLVTMLETIEKNHPSRTSLDVSAPADYGAENPERKRIVSGYERSMGVLEPILRQIEYTDGLIDQIVYRLYGVTEAEIALVESEIES